MSDTETVILDFEKPIVDIEEKIQHLKMIAMLFLDLLYLIQKLVAVKFNTALK